MLRVFGREVLYIGKRVSLVNLLFRDSIGGNNFYEVIQSNFGKYVEQIFGVDSNDNVILIYQQRLALSLDNCDDFERRHSVFTYELPGGMVGDQLPGETAKKELKEECGYSIVDGFNLLAEHVPCDVGRYEMETNIYFARVRETSIQTLEKEENIKVVKIPVDRVVSDIVSRPYVDPKIAIAFLLARHRGLI